MLTRNARRKKGVYRIFNKKRKNLRKKRLQKAVKFDKITQ
jgi:hypothetical protein